MMRVFWEEWRAAGAFSAVRVLPPLALVSALALVISGFHPGALLLVVVLTALVGGVLSGTQRWNKILDRDWVGLEGVSPWGYALGKVVGLVLSELVWVAFLTPLLVLVALVWGMPWEVAAAGLAWALVASLGAQALGHVVSWGTSEFLRVLGGLLVFLWIAATLQSPAAQPFNPLWQVWHQFHDPQTSFDGGAAGLLVAVSALFWVVVAARLAHAEARR